MSMQQPRSEFERNQAIAMLASWCITITDNGTSWDDWDEHYKDAAHRPGPLRDLIDAEILKQRGKPITEDL